MKIETLKVSKIYNSRLSKTVAVQNCSISIENGEIVGLYGDSGSGKSTIGKILTGVECPTSGAVYFDGEQVRYPLSKEYQKKVHYIFQHPETSFNPKLTIKRSLIEIFKNNKIHISENVLIGKMQQFGLYKEHLTRYPSELSGGELQRFAILRAILMSPKFIVLDEPTSMLDSISQAQIMGILKSVYEDFKIPFLFVSHSKALIDIFCTKVYKVENGEFTLI